MTTSPEKRGGGGGGGVYGEEKEGEKVLSTPTRSMVQAHTQANTHL